MEAIQPVGIKTRMFGYQLRTLHRMLQREREPEKVHSGHFIPLKTASGRLIYLHPSTLEVKVCLSSSHSVHDARGGILSEEMGVGKTLECIALILSTRGSLPTIDSNEPMASSITSTLAMDWPHKDGHGLDPVPKYQLALEKIPYYSANVERQARPPISILSGSSPQSIATSLSSKQLPPLRQLCAHVLRLSGQSIAPEQYSKDDRFKVLAMETLLKSATPFFHLWPPLRGNRTPRVEVERLPVKVYLSTATLVVVPGNLQAQWQGEIDKHTKPGSLRVLYLPHAQSVIPPAIDLANNYDLILLSHSRLGKEYNEGSLEWKWPSVPRECRCPYLGSSRTVICSCPPVQSYQPSQEMSPLLQCWFKRLCLDEGHVAAGDSDMVRMANKIRSECRWVISGTPTESFVGSDLFRGHHYKDRRVGVTKTERKDLEKLQALLGDFLCIPHLQDWHTHYENPFKKGAVYSSTRIWKLLGRVMVRHQPQDIDIPLPPLKDAVVRLEFTRLERITFNVLISLIVLNAVWSQREDDDYFFHHSNRKYLASIMENLSLSCFHFAGPHLRDQSEDALKHALKQLAEEKKWSKMDRKKAQFAIDRLEEALQDETWLKRSSDVVYGTSHLREEIVRSWTRQGLHKTLQLTADEVMAMQRAMRTILDQQESEKLDSDDFTRTEELITMGVLSRRAFFEEKEKVEQGKKDTLNQAVQKQQRLQSPTLDPFLLPCKSSPSKRASQLRKKSKMSILDYTILQFKERKRLPSHSDLAHARLSSGSSTKLAKLLQILSSVPKEEKIIIFSNLDNVLYEVSTALDVSGLAHFIYASGSSQDKRNEVISAFRSDQTFVRILLMKINIGGRGLDLSCANHAIFLEPILDKSLQVQALKRTWRTGQTRPVYATTLIMRETFEEDVLRLSDTATTCKLSEDPSMREVVSNPTFISSGSRHISQALTPAITLFPTEQEENPMEDAIEVPLPTPPVTPDKYWSIKGKSNHESIKPNTFQHHTELGFSSHLCPTSPVEPVRSSKKRRVAFA